MIKTSEQNHDQEESFQISSLPHGPNLFTLHICSASSRRAIHTHCFRRLLPSPLTSGVFNDIFLQKYPSRKEKKQEEKENLQSAREKPLQSS